MSATSTPPVHRGVLEEPRLLAAGPGAGWAEHLDCFGPLPQEYSDPQILSEWEASGLAGRGGGAFPTARKIAAVQRAAARSRRAPVVIGNGSEGEPLSFKDQLLLRHAPHLVLDGLLLTARILGARESYIAAKSGLHPRLLDALAERGETSVSLHATDSHFLAGQATAVISSMEGGPSLPRHASGHLSDAGLAGAPTLLVNVETLAHLALIARYSSSWFRTAGTAADPGSRLLTVHDQGRYQVHEVHGSSDLSLVLEQLQISAASVQAVLIGGYHGQWTIDLDVRLSAANDDRHHPAALAAGAGVIEIMRHDICPLARTSQIIDYLARASARQCGPCLHGLPTLARDVQALAQRFADPKLPEQINRLGALVAGRGSCHHPDASARLAISALQVFDDEVAAHLSGTCHHNTQEQR
ncbi:hypothetical protein OF385_13640 [Glutamicibacter sp. JL.03c]|uniref:NADH-ubiquinone oxidoreductase-F iron-sulfur binding region domain-containing protein n=1 Tax=Glutamicibacter sp. JL.03c TaxID=2984842 RepID=UPI0021F71E61|nr:NADH-ubiquinone oxidoreductase-F iron-sulfur binding region domain-containing protein [Glutamicibacter sp. JL.03c]UYQ77047.1 hypothetical protein OF385_13640 [Glutamicibacter sp. JL.03c]